MRNWIKTGAIRIGINTHLGCQPRRQSPSLLSLLKFIILYMYINFFRTIFGNAVKDKFHFMHSFICLLFMYLKDKVIDQDRKWEEERERGRKKTTYLLFYFPNSSKVGKAEVINSTQISHNWERDPKTWPSFCCFIDE